MYKWWYWWGLGDLEVKVLYNVGSYISLLVRLWGCPLLLGPCRLPPCCHCFQGKRLRLMLPSMALLLGPCRLPPCCHCL